MLYFIKSGQFIKVGVSNRPWDRLAEMQTGNPELLEMLAIAPGSYEFESELHKLFGEHRGVGEWFRDNERIRAVVAFWRETFPELQIKPKVEHEPESAVVEFIQEFADMATDYSESGSCWLEFRTKHVKRDGSSNHYGRYRGWVKENGKWIKRFISNARIKLNEDEYREYKRSRALPARYVN